MSAAHALVLTLVMGAVIFFCRAFPFIFFSGGKTRREVFISFVEKIVPPVAMTVLAFNLVSGSIKADMGDGINVLIASAVTAALHLWRRNALLSIIGGTALYMVLTKAVLF